MSSTGARRIATDALIERGTGLYIPWSGTTPGGEYGASISNANRTYAIVRTPVGYRVVFTLAHDIWDKWFKLEIEGAKDDENKEFDKKVQAELRRLHAKRELDRMTIFERGYGWAIIGISYVGTKDHAEKYDPLDKDSKNGGYKDIVDLRAYGPTNITSVQTEKSHLSERYGFPVEYRIEQSGVSRRFRLHYTRAIHVATRLLEHDWKGKSVLDCAWDDIVTLQNERWSMGQTLYRYGSGFPDLEFTGAEKAKLQEFIDSGGMNNIFQRSFFVHNEKQKIDFKGVGGVALDPMNYYLPVMESISLATGIPLAILRGAQAGALTGSEVNEREYQGLISDEQSMYEEALMELITAILKQPRMQNKTEDAQTAAEPKIPDFKIVWESGLELTEVEKVDLEIKKAQLLQTKGQWHTRNELRKMDDPTAKPLTVEQGGEEILGRHTLREGDEQFDVQPNPDGSQTVTKRAPRH